MKRRLVPIVQIITRRPFEGKERQPPSPPAPTEPTSPSPNVSLRKKQKINSRSEQARSDIPASPTVSDFENEERHSLLASPAVSDFATHDMVFDLALVASDDEDGPLSLLPVSDELSTSVSGSNMTLDKVSPNFVDPQASQFYKIVDDEIVEDGDITIPGETLVEDSAGSEDIPVRVLSDFTIYDAKTNLLIPLAVLATLKYSKQEFGASGLVTPWIDEDDDGYESNFDDEDEDENTNERVKLSGILEFNVHSFSEVSNSLDSKIYIRTPFAWYILDMPSDQYRPFFLPFWVQHQILHLLITAAIRTPQISYDGFLETLQGDDGAGDDDRSGDAASDDVLTSLRMLGRTLTEIDVQSDDVKSYIIGSLADICELHRIRFKSVPVLQTYLGLDSLGLDYDNHSHSTSPRKSAQKTKHTKLKGKTSNKEVEVLKHRNTTVVTPIVSSIAKHLFKGVLEVAGTFDVDDTDVAAEIDNIQDHHTDPASMKWGPGEPEGGKYYQSVIMDGVKYQVGDNVMVNPGDDDNMVRARNAQTEASQSPNSYANRVWFAKICYFYEEHVDGKLVKKFHAQWFVHGSKTILQETAHSKSLFLSFECWDNPIASIFKKCNVTMLGSEEAESPDNRRPDENDFHCALAYNEKDVEFVDLPPEHEITQLIESLPPHMPCISCGMQKREEACEQFTPISNGFSHHGIHYHCHDFIYIRPEGMAGLLDIAQIVKIKNASGLPHVTVHYFGRHDDYVRNKNYKDTQATQGSSRLVFDERQLFRRIKKQTLTNPELIDGLCHVRQLINPEEIDDWVRHNDHFYVYQEEKGSGELLDMGNNALAHCDTCYNARAEKLKQDWSLMNLNGHITCLELFCGAGGLGTGLDMSGFVETKYAVEFSPSAAATYKRNHPSTEVYCQDSSLLLKHAIETDAGKNPKALVSNDGKTCLPQMPKKNSIDMISGGPPCQSFSRANHNPRADDIRSTLPGNMLSYVEHYNPQYFLLENVAGLLKHRLMSTRSKNSRSLEGGIESGMVKFIMRSLIALGYQVRCKLLQAGQYGAPQSRPRVIFWGAKRGVTIPNFPVPMYAFQKGMHRTTLPTGGFMYPVSRSLDSDNPHQCAPLRAITVDDAIGDLPPFDWINPHDIIAVKGNDKQEVKQRIKQGIQQFRAVQLDRKSMDLPGFPKGAAYSTQPMNRYQKWLRQEMENKKVGEHYTKTFSSRLVEATTTVPLKPLANHRDLPLDLQPRHARPGANQAKKSFYGRMDGTAQFRCAMTQVAPNLKEAWVLHPSQKRIVTVRECARAQGFPDSYIFESVDEKKKVENQIRQIGNAVPVPFALHLGKSLGEALLKDWEKKMREGSPAV